MIILDDSIFQVNNVIKCLNTMRPDYDTRF